MKKTDLIQLLILALLILPYHLSAQQSSARKTRLEAFSGLYEGTVFTPGYCETDMATAKIYINVTSDPPVMYIDGVRATATKMSADTLVTSAYHLGYFSTSGDEVFFHFYYDLDGEEELFWEEDWDDESDVEYIESPGEHQVLTWKKIISLKDSESYLKRYEQNYTEVNKFWSQFLAALDKGDTNLLRPFIASDFRMWDYDYEDVITPDYPVTEVWQTMEMNREMLLDFLLYEIDEEYDEESVEELEIPATFSEIIGSLVYFGDSDNCFPGSFILYDAPVSLFVKRINNEWKIYMMQYF